jgi:hypothetical protein
MNQAKQKNQERAWQRILKQKDWGKKFNLLLQYGKKYGQTTNRHGNVNGAGNAPTSKRNTKKSKDTSKV